MIQACCIDGYKFPRLSSYINCVALVQTRDLRGGKPMKPMNLCFNMQLIVHCNT